MLHGIRDHHSVAVANIKEGLGYRYPLCCILHYAIRIQLGYIMPFNLRILMWESWSKYAPKHHMTTKWIRCPLHRETPILFSVPSMEIFRFEEHAFFSPFNGNFSLQESQFEGRPTMSLKLYVHSSKDGVL